MKKIVFAILSTLLLILLFSCMGNDPEIDENSSASSIESTEMGKEDTSGVNGEVGQIKNVNDKYFVFESTNGELYKIELSYFPNAAVGDKLAIYYTDRKQIDNNTFSIEPINIQRLHLKAVPFA